MSEKKTDPDMYSLVPDTWYYVRMTLSEELVEMKFVQYTNVGRRQFLVFTYANNGKYMIRVNPEHIIAIADHPKYKPCQCDEPKTQQSKVFKGCKAGRGKNPEDMTVEEALRDFFAGIGFNIKI